MCHLTKGKNAAEHHLLSKFGNQYIYCNILRATVDFKYDNCTSFALKLDI